MRAPICCCAPSTSAPNAPWGAVRACAICTAPSPCAAGPIWPGCACWWWTMSSPPAPPCAPPAPHCKQRARSTSACWPWRARLRTLNKRAACACLAHPPSKTGAVRHGIEQAVRLNAAGQIEEFGLLAKLKDAVQVEFVGMRLGSAQLVARDKKWTVLGKAGGFDFDPLLVARQIKGANIKAQTIAQGDSNMLDLLRQIG